MPTTPNYEWEIPVVGGSSGVWGTILNDFFGELDTDLKSVEDLAGEAMPKAGGNFEGAVRFERTRCLVHDMGTVSGSVDIRTDDSDPFGGRDFKRCVVTGDTTFAFNPAVWASTDEGVVLTLEITNGGAHNITWPGSVVWNGAQEPVLLSTGTDIVTFYTRDGGTTVFGMHAGSFLTP